MAGQSRQALRTRIKSVQSTRKITKAMEMIANAKLFRQRSKMESNREYAQRLQDTVNEIVTTNPDAESRYLTKTMNEHKMTIVFCSDLGLCGGYNSNVLKMAKEELNPEDPLILIGVSLYHQFQEWGFHLLNAQPISSDKITFQELKKAVEQGTVLYQSEKVGTVQLLYTSFINTMTFRTEIDVLLPCRITAEQKIKEPEQRSEGKELQKETLFEPNAASILDRLIPMMVQDVAYADWMESTTAEQGSRRVAMKTASDNADDLNQSLLLEYNKARQAAITQEITEIVGGSNAV